MAITVRLLRLRTQSRVGNIDDMRLVDAMGRLSEYRFRGDGNQHLILFSGEIKNLPAPGLVKLGEHIIENHNRLQSQLAETISNNAIFKANAIVHISPFEANSRAGMSLSRKVHVIALRTDKVHAASHFAGVDALEMTADFCGCGSSNISTSSKEGS